MLEDRFMSHGRGLKEGRKNRQYECDEGEGEEIENGRKE
jgi:hypothetical protein